MPAREPPMTETPPNVTVEASQGAVHLEVDPSIYPLEAIYGAEHPNLGDVLTDLAEIAIGRGAHDEADAHLERAVAIWEKGFGPEYPELSKPLRVRGRLELRRGRPGDAVAPLERALALRESGAGVNELAGIRLDLARALWDGGRDRLRARALAEEAQRSLGDAVDPAAVKTRAEVDAWLAAHPRAGG